MRLEEAEQPYSVRTSAEGQGSRIIHRVRSARVREAATGQVHTYVPLSIWGLSVEGAGPVRVQRRDTGGGDAWAVAFGDDLPEGGTLAVDVRYSHGSLPRLCLGRGDVDRPGRTLPEGTKVTNVLRPTPYRPAPADEARVHALTRLARSDLARSLDAPSLRGLLRALDRGSGMAGHRFAAAVRELSCRPETRLCRGVVEQGFHVSLGLDTQQLGEAGQAYLLGELLRDLLASWAPIDRYLALTLRLEPEGAEVLWTAS